MGLTNTLLEPASFALVGNCENGRGEEFNWNYVPSREELVARGSCWRSYVNEIVDRLLAMNPDEIKEVAGSQIVVILNRNLGWFRWRPELLNGFLDTRYVRDNNLPCNGVERDRFFRACMEIDRNDYATRVEEARKALKMGEAMNRYEQI